VSRQTAYLGLGANLGDAAGTLREALRRIDRLDGTRVAAVSSAYGSDPVGGVEQPPYVNGVARVRTSLAAAELLAALLEVERALGRVRGVRFGPRSCDLDLLLYGSLRVAGPALEVPHPRLGERRFVLEPLAELEPELVLPDGRRVADLLAAVADQGVWRLDDVRLR
jgi:2-amino-4-hydroxy-6-hydroxymethyldihydropteridine diphosphokinase